MMPVSHEQLNKFMSDNELTFTNNFRDAIYMLANGNLISGVESDGDGIRTLDHNIIDGLIDGNIYQHPKLFRQFISINKIVVLVPETKTAVIAKTQHLTSIQMANISNNGYKISY